MTDSVWGGAQRKQTQKLANGGLTLTQKLKVNYIFFSGLDQKDRIVEL